MSELGLIIDISEEDLPEGELHFVEGLRRKADSFPMVAICDDEEKGNEYLKKGTPVIGYEGSRGRLPFHYLLTSFEGASLSYMQLVYNRFFDIPLEILRTQRCIVREFAMSDMDGLFKLYEAPGMTDHVEPLYERQEEEEYQRTYISNIYDLYDFGMWVVCDNSTGELIGRAGLEDKGDYKEKGLCLGYMIRTDHQRKGLGTEVVKAILGYAIDKGEKRFYCSIDEDNEASIAFIKRLGFTLEGDFWRLEIKGFD